MPAPSRIAARMALVALVAAVEGTEVSERLAAHDANTGQVGLRKPSIVRPQKRGASDREERYRRYLEFAGLVEGGSVQPRWMAGGSRFWYAESTGDGPVIREVDPEANTIATRRVTNEELARRSSRSLATDVGGHPVRFELRSPDGRWFAGVKDHDVWVRSIADDRSIQITADGMPDYAWDIGGARWSPDSSKLLIRKIDDRKVFKLPIVHWLQPLEAMEWHPLRSTFSTTRAGLPLPITGFYVLDIPSGKKTTIDIGGSADHHLFAAGWQPDSSEAVLARADRGFGRITVLAAETRTGRTRTLLSETSSTFLRGIYLPFDLPHLWFPTADAKHFIWISEKDGWNHLYLHDASGGAVRQLTHGAVPAVGIEGVDRNGEWIYFTAHGDAARPYDTHLYRVRPDGRDLGPLTSAEGQHAIEFSPSGQFFLDTHSSLDRPPAVELRKADGTLVRVLSRANTAGLGALGWKAPEEFVVKAADGRTNLHGVLYKPADFDARRKYPVVEFIYGCPTETAVERGFVPVWNGLAAQALAQRGYITFIVDARGTPERGKAFQDVAHRNLGEHEIPDHLAALRQLGDARPYMNLDRVGITGHSCGGYFTIRAMLLAPQVYRVGVASAPVTDLRFGNAMEVYMGPPQDYKEAYDRASLLRIAKDLRGRLLLVHGTSDFSVPLSETIKLVEAFIQAGRPYDLLLLPEQDHILSGVHKRYSQLALANYFDTHLK